MIRGIVKKGVIGVGLGAAALFALFGTRAMYYGQYAYDRARETARSAVPFEADVEVARRQVTALEPAIMSGIESLAKLDTSIAQLEGEITALDSRIEGTTARATALRDSLDRQGVQRVSTSDAAARRTRVKLGRELDELKRAKYIVEVKQQELEHRTAQRQKLHETLMGMKDKQEALLSKIQEIEARHDALKVTRSYEDVSIDTGALSDAERAVLELDRRVNLEQRKFDLKEQFGLSAAGATGLDCDEDAEACDADLLRQADELLGRPADGPRTADREL